MVETSLKKLEQEDLKCRTAVTIARSGLDRLEKTFKPFSKNELGLMKDILSNKWAKVEEKVSNLAKEVFEEVMEQEMALARMESVSLKDAIP